MCERVGIVSEMWGCGDVKKVGMIAGHGALMRRCVGGVAVLV